MRDKPLATSPVTKKHGAEEHKQKAIHDKDLAEKLQHDNAFPDWVVTCSFYSALHCIDAYAHKLGKHDSFEAGPDENIGAHTKRAIFVDRTLGREFFGSYNTLRSHCDQCRYDPKYYKLMLPIVPNTMLKLAQKFLKLVQ
jgi:hypothetical protein